MTLLGLAGGKDIEDTVSKRTLIPQMLTHYIAVMIIQCDNGYKSRKTLFFFKSVCTLQPYVTI